MKNVLARGGAGILSALANSRSLLAFDFDGTLAPISADRDTVHMCDATRILFEQVCSLYPCAVISGRSRADAAQRLGAAAVKYVIGNHGIEPGPDLDRFEKEIRVARAQLEEALTRCSGVEIEDKRFSLAIHFRKSPDRDDAHAVVIQAVKDLAAAVRAVPGKLTVNVVPLASPHKGDALASIRRMEEAAAVLYVGDDVTDEDVFRLNEPGLVGVRVGKSRQSAASYFIRSQREIDSLLARLVAERPKPALWPLSFETRRFPLL